MSTIGEKMANAIAAAMVFVGGILIGLLLTLPFWY